MVCGTISESSVALLKRPSTGTVDDSPPEGNWDERKVQKKGKSHKSQQMRSAFVKQRLLKTPSEAVIDATEKPADRDPELNSRRNANR
jgi:hypothetical protein